MANSLTVRDRVLRCPVLMLSFAALLLTSSVVYGQENSQSGMAQIDADGDGMLDSTSPRDTFGPPQSMQPFTVGTYIGSGLGGGPAFADRVEFLGFSVLRWTSPDQITASSLAGIDVLFVYTGVERDIVGKDAIIADWVFQGNGLIVEQPNRSGVVTILPPGLDIGIISQFVDGSNTGPDPVRNVHITSLGTTHPIMFTLTDADIPENFDQVRTSGVSSSYEILGVQSTDNDLVAVAVAVFGEGRVVFHTGNTTPAAFSPGSDQYVQQMINWAGDGPPEGACCISNQCELLSSIACESASGTYFGDDTLCSAPDFDGDGVRDECDMCPLDNPDDTDGDGVCDSLDACPTDPSKIDPGMCGCGVPESGDTDLDGIEDCVDRCPGGDDAVFGDCSSSVPTISSWGIFVLCLLLLVGTKIYVLKIREPIA